MTSCYSLSPYFLRITLRSCLHLIPPVSFPFQHSIRYCGLHHTAVLSAKTSLPSHQPTSSVHTDTSSISGTIKTPRHFANLCVIVCLVFVWRDVTTSNYYADWLPTVSCHHTNPCQHSAVILLLITIMPILCIMIELANFGWFNKYLNKYDTDYWSS